MDAKLKQAYIKAAIYIFTNQPFRHNSGIPFFYKFYTEEFPELHKQMFEHSLSKFYQVYDFNNGCINIYRNKDDANYYTRIQSERSRKTNILVLEPKTHGYDDFIKQWLAMSKIISSPEISSQVGNDIHNNLIYATFRPNIFSGNMANFRWFSHDRSEQFSMNNSSYDYFKNILASKTEEKLSQCVFDMRFAQLEITLTDEEAKKLRYEKIKTKLDRMVSPMKYLEWPLLFKGNKTKKLYGIELEVSSEYTPKQIIELQEKSGPVFMICKHDGSVSGAYNQLFEMVTVPGSYTGLKVAFREFFRNCDIKKFDTTKSTNNGLHIHINKEYFYDGNVDNGHLDKFNWFFQNPINRNFIEAISERNSGDISRWSPFVNWSGKETRLKSKDIMKVARREAESIRGAVHFSGEKTGGKTVEIRIFKGIVSFSSIIKCLDFVDSVVVWTSEPLMPTQITFDNYLRWLESTEKNKYIVLKRFFETLNMKENYQNYFFQGLMTIKDGFSLADTIDLLRNNGIFIEETTGRFYTKNGEQKTYLRKNENELLTKIQRSPVGLISHCDAEFIMKTRKPV